MFYYSWDSKKFCFFFHPQDFWKMNFSKQEKYSIVTKFATFSPSCHPYLNPVNLFTRISIIKIWIFFSEKADIPPKQEKSNACWYNSFSSNLEQWSSYFILKVKSIYLLKVAVIVKFRIFQILDFTKTLKRNIIQPMINTNWLFHANFISKVH